jgi:hypothetical protein
MERIRSGTDGYAPVVLPRRYAVVTTTGDILDGVANPFEHPTQSASRANAQETVWNWVWGRRVVYFLTVFASLYLALLPVDHPPIGLAGAVLPGFAAPWIEAFKSNPGVFAWRAGLVAGLLLAGGWLQGKIAGRMRGLWEEIIVAGPRPRSSLSPLPGDPLYRLRSHPAYQAFFRILTRQVIPFVFVLCIVVAAPTAASRLLFGVGSSIGWVCRAHEKAETTVVVATAPAKGRFDPSDPCWASGLGLDQGVRYRISIRVEGAEWRDDGISTDLEGFGWNRMTAAMIAGLPLRRHLTEPWFKPSARIGARGRDEYSLEPTVPFAPGDDRRTMTTEITARTSGELFLYVNDAVVGLPGVYDVFYRHNRGGADVTVERVRAPAVPAATQ